MKIVHLEDFFHPATGYQINVLAKYMVKAGHQVTIVAGQLDKGSVPTFFSTTDIDKQDAWYTQQYGVKIVRVPVLGRICHREILSSRFYEVIHQEKPDLVFVHDNDKLTSMRYLWNYHKMGYPVVLDSHMLEMASKNKLRHLFRWFYRTFFTPIIVKNHLSVIRIQDDPFVEKCLGIPLTQAPFISVGTDTLLFHPDKTVKQQMRQKYHIPADSFVILYAGKLDDNKGGVLLAKTLQKKFNVSKPLHFVVVGDCIGEYGQQVETLFAASENKILRLPTQRYIDLPSIYQMADLSLFPKQCSLSFYDVQACGLPVLFEDNSVNIGRAQMQNAFVFKQNSVEDFRKQLVNLININPQSYAKLQQNAVDFVVKNYDYADITKQYLAIIEQTIQFFKEKNDEPSAN